MTTIIIIYEEYHVIMQQKTGMKHFIIRYEADTEIYSGKTGVSPRYESCFCFPDLRNLYYGNPAKADLLFPLLLKKDNSV